MPFVRIVGGEKAEVHVVQKHSGDCFLAAIFVIAILARSLVAGEWMKGFGKGALGDVGQLPM